MTTDERHIRAAQGFIDLDLADDALAELAALTPEAAQTTEAIETRLLCELNAKHWSAALQLAERLCQTEPSSPVGYVHAAYCLHELGRTHDAVRQLEKGPSSLHNKSLYYYNLGCYHTQLGNLEKALGLLRKSFEMDETLRRAAKRDPDLQPLVNQLP
jgi:tetratricopeptide (TPR) repeat protein